MNLGVAGPTFALPPYSLMFVTVLIAYVKADVGRGLSNYQTGAFDALEWAWHMLRSLDKKKGVDEARCIILETLSKMGEGARVNFVEMTSEVKTIINC